ncbi:MAG: superoxide dismutase family protein, partial [Ilumatobacteraceae bacterium]|nr:superoxide dismutase family protein [Ilumatobacteraceae bacterium]
PFADAGAAVHVVATGSGASVVTLHVTGVDADPGRTFGAHVHQLPCGELGSAAGGHYLHAGLDPTLPLEQREVWLDVTVNAAGNGHAVALRPWIVDQSSQRSVILHANPTAADGTAGARLACVDLDGD